MHNTDSLRELLVRGMAAAKAGQKDEARFYLNWLLRVGAPEEMETDAWWWLSQVADDPAEARRCLEEVLARHSAHPQARRALAVLDGRLQTSAIVDPDRLPPASDAGTADLQRFSCPRCGGGTAASSDSAWLECAYCGWRRSLETGAIAPEQDFVVAMATARGHRRPERVRTVHCRGCGAPFMLPPEMLSLTCPYCASAHVVEQAASEDLVPPDGILPFAYVDPQSAAARSLKASARRVRTWRAMYLPVWSFGISGEIPWTGVREAQEGRRRETVRGSILVLEKDYLVPATRRLPERWPRPALTYSCDSLRTFRPEALADRPAETYQIPMSDAAVGAHAEVFASRRDAARREMPSDIRELRFDSTRFTLDSFRLILAPAWIGLSGDPSPQPIVFVNGQNGRTASE